MQKKFKEYRMFWVCLFIFIMFVGLAIYSFIRQDVIKAILALVFVLMATFLLVGRYKMVLFDDMMMIYEWKVAVMLPTMIEYKNIQSIEKKSQHHIVIKHTHQSHIYVFDSDAFINAYHEFKKKDQ